MTKASGLSDSNENNVSEKTWYNANKWLILRRLSQIMILFLFLLGPLWGIWIIKGNLSFSMTMSILPLSDPYVLLQSFAAGHNINALALTGGLIVLVFYLLIGGRVFCSWVCPVNMITDAAASLRKKYIKTPNTRLSRSVRYWMLGMTVIAAFFSGTIIWELVNPVSMFHRGLIFGLGLAWFIVLSVFLFDLFISRNGWCGHLCPVGAFYSLLGSKSILRVSASARDQCNNCMDCFKVCPESQIIKPALKGAKDAIGPIIDSGNCTNCGRCIDVCQKEVFRFSTRFNNNV